MDRGKTQSSKEAGEEHRIAEGRHAAGHDLRLPETHPRDEVAEQKFVEHAMARSVEDGGGSRGVLAGGGAERPGVNFFLVA